MALTGSRLKLLDDERRLQKQWKTLSGANANMSSWTKPANQGRETAPVIRCGCSSATG
jgi:hypothetical protein